MWLNFPTDPPHKTSPVASVNIPDRLDTKDWHVQIGNKLGTVGLPMPGSGFRIVNPETLESLAVDKDGLILISGVQVMSGYLNAPDKTKEVIINLDDKYWYKTGDKGHLDKGGHLTIVDRYSRFAKIGGEMISLGAIESAIQKLLPPETEILSTAIPDGKKGETIVLLYTGSVQQEELKGLINQSNLNPLMKPSQFVSVDSIPKLGSGKNDFSQAKQIAMGVVE